MTQISVTTNRVLHTPSEFSKTHFLYLQEAGELTALRPHTSLRKFKSFLFLIVLNGKGTLNYDGKIHNMEKGDCAFIDCRKSYSHQTDKTFLWSLAWVHFDGNQMDAIYNEYKKLGGLAVFHSDNHPSLLQIIENIIAVADKPQSNLDFAINSNLCHLLSIISSEKSSQLQTEHRTSARLVGIIDYLNENYCSDISLEFIAESYNINKFYLTRIFKAEYGLTIMDYIIKKRITKAKQLLRFSDQKIKFVAEQCGFNDACYFNRIFRRQEGVNPSVYRGIWSKSE